MHILKGNGLTEGIDFIINGNEESRVPGILSLSFAGKSGEMILVEIIRSKGSCYEKDI